MENESLLALLEETVQRLGISVRYERLDGPGIQVRDGLCRIREQNVLFIDKRHPPHERIRILAEIIGDFGNEEIFMPPVVRELVDKTKSPLESPE